MTKVQRAILACLMDNKGQMTFEHLKFDCSLASSPQGLGRSIGAMLKLGWVTVFPSWNNENSVGITYEGKKAIQQDLRS